MTPQNSEDFNISSHDTSQMLTNSRKNYNVSSQWADINVMLGTLFFYDQQSNLEIFNAFHEDR